MSIATGTIIGLASINKKYNIGMKTIYDTDSPYETIEQVREEQIQRRIENFFDKYDTNKDGIITKGEYKERIK